MDLGKEACQPAAIGGAPGMKRYLELTKVKQIGTFTLRLTFNDDVTKDVDFAAYLKKKRGLFQQLNKPSEFKKFNIDMAGGLAWKCGVDLAPEVLFAL